MSGLIGYWIELHHWLSADIADVEQWDVFRPGVVGMELPWAIEEAN